MNDAATDGFLGLLRWSDPIIVDRLISAYRDKFADYAVSRELGLAHARLWRALIVGDSAEFVRRRSELSRTLGEFSCGLDDFAAVDSAILVELLEIVVARFQRSQRVAVGYHLALIELATRMQLPHAA